MRKTVAMIGRIIMIILVSALIGYDIYLFNATYVCNDRLPMPFGRGTAVIMSGSMEPAISVHDVVIVKKESTYEVGDIITYVENGSLVTHRIVEKRNDVIVTRGDANNTEDPAIHEKDILGKVTGIVPKVGSILLFLQKPIGMVCIMLLLFGGMELSFKHSKKEKEKRLRQVRAEIEELRKEVQQISLTDYEAKKKDKVASDVYVRLNDTGVDWIPEKITSAPVETACNQNSEEKKETDSTEQKLDYELVDREDDYDFVPPQKRNCNIKWDSPKKNFEKKELVSPLVKKSEPLKKTESLKKEETSVEKKKVNDKEVSKQTWISGKQIAVMVVLLFVIAINIVSLITQKQGKPFTVAGYSLVMIRSNSMEPAIRQNDIVFLQEKSVYENGEVVTYRENGDLITHRIVEKSEAGYVTKGDANQAIDRTLVAKENIIGKVVRVNGLLGLLVQIVLSPILFVVIMGGLVFSGIVKKCKEASERKAGENAKNFT